MAPSAICVSSAALSNAHDSADMPSARRCASEQTGQQNLSANAPVNRHA
ncbi:hypothetical protein R69888_02066 [Paraburkholderia haematera]|uniref:Uncharacterized protein n=1 Tax=Paraburkholderia haematera TaxID=2793077 RepID=A0ABM8R3L4_9BURK|nr:hypothetical protein R69888_02066 [Paraburkholderia haematera]